MTKELINVINFIKNLQVTHIDENPIPQNTIINILKCLEYKLPNEINKMYKKEPQNVFLILNSILSIVSIKNKRFHKNPIKSDIQYLLSSIISKINKKIWSDFFKSDQKNLMSLINGKLSLEKFNINSKNNVKELLSLIPDNSLDMQILDNESVFNSLLIYYQELFLPKINKQSIINIFINLKRDKSENNEYRNLCYEWEDKYRLSNFISFNFGIDNIYSETEIMNLKGLRIEKKYKPHHKQITKLKSGINFIKYASELVGLENTFHINNIIFTDIEKINTYLNKEKIIKSTINFIPVLLVYLIVFFPFLFIPQIARDRFLIFKEYKKVGSYVNIMIKNKEIKDLNDLDFVIKMINNNPKYYNNKNSNLTPEALKAFKINRIV